METVNGVPEGDKGGPPPPSPLTGCYLLIVVGEPYTEQHKDIILQRIAKGLLSWELNSCLVDLEKELAIITEQALEGEEARYGERLIQFASENLVTEILIHPVVSTLAQCMRNLLSSFTRHRHIIHSGYTFAANGSWALQDGTFSYSDFSEAFQEIDVQRVIHAYENGISLDLHCSPEGEWTRLPKEQFAKACKARVNPTDVLTSGSPAIASFTNYLAPFLVPTSLENLLESSDVVGNIRFSRPTLYVFPGGQGDAALFGINGFNMLLDGGFSRKACFWDFVRHLDRLDAVLMTRLNNSNVGGIGSVLRRKKQDAVYPQLGHFFCNIQERRALLSPDGDKDKDPLLINLLDEGQDIISNLRHLNLNPQVCYRDSEPINLYHKVGHGTLDMYVLSPAKDSKEVREFLQKWNQCDQKLFANSKSSREFTFPIQNLISIAALLVWQPADPNDTITRILFPGSSPQNKIFEGLDKLKNLEFIKHSVCTERSLVPISITKKTAKDPILEKVTPKEKTPVEKKDNKIIENNIISAVNGDIKEKTVKKSDSTESERSTKTKKSEESKITENGDKAKPKLRTSKSRSGSQQRKKAAEKKASPTTPKKIIENGESKKPSKPSPISTPAKSAKDANNRKVIESKAKREGVVKAQQPPEPKPKVERKPISRRPVAKKAPLSPAKKLVSGVQKPDSISRKGKLDKEGTTDSSTVSTPSADQETVLKKDLSKLTPDEIQQLKAQELADLKEEQEAIKEIEAVFRKGESLPAQDETLRKVRDDSIDEKLNKEEYLIVEKEEVEHESLSDTKENETQKLARDSEESEKQRKLSSEDKIEDISAEIKKESPVEDIVKTKVDALESSKVSLEDKLDLSTDKKTNGKELEDDVKDVMESQPDEKISANIKSGDTTTAPTLPEDERIPLDEIKEDNGHVIEEKYVKEETKEKEIPIIQLPQKQSDNVSKLPGAVGIRLDKQQHIRDIVKTPDEVADLPVHEEVDYEYTHELKAETPKSNEIMEKQFEDQPETTRYSKEQEKGVEQEKDKDEVIQEMIEQIENITSSIPVSDLIARDDIVNDLEEDMKQDGLEGKKESEGKTEQTKNIVESHAEQQYEKVLDLKTEIKPAEDEEKIDEVSEHAELVEEKIKSTIEKGMEDTKHVPYESTEENIPKEREEDNIPLLPTVTEVKSELDRINEGVLKAAKEDKHQLEKLDEKLQQLKQSQMDVEEDKRHFSPIQGEKSEDILKSIEKATHELTKDFIREDTIEKSQPKSPVEMIEKGELGRKSPKEREEDVIKIVASVAEVLKSDAPLEEFEGKLPITTTISSYTSPYTTELRETHITTVDSPVIEYKVIKTDIPTIPEEPHIASASFIEEEKKIWEVHESKEEKPEDKRSSLLKESQELMMTTSRMISDIKSAKPEEIVKREVSAEKVNGMDSITSTDDKIEEEESGIIHRMLVTASSEDGGEETEICPPGTIIFPRSSESSGRSSPEPSQKVSQKSSVVETISDTLSTVKQVAEFQSEMESGIVGESEETISPLPELKSTDLSDGPSAVLEKSEEVSSQIMTSGKSSPDKDASIKSLASGKSTPDMSDLEKFKEVTSSSEDLKKDDDSRSIKEFHSEKYYGDKPVVGETDVKTQILAITEPTDLVLEQPPPEKIPKSEVELRQKSVVDIVEDKLESGIAAVTEFTKSIFSSDEENNEKVSDHIADKEITTGVTAAVKEEIGGEIPSHETDGISDAMTQSVILVAEDASPDDKPSHDDQSKVVKESEVPKGIISVGVDKHIADVESLIEGIGSRIGDTFDAVAEYIHPAKEQIVTETIEEDGRQEKVIEDAAFKSAKVQLTEEQREISPPKGGHEELHAPHELGHSPQDTDEKKDAGQKIEEELKGSLDENAEVLDDKVKKDWSDRSQEPLLGEELTKLDITIEKSSLDDSIIVSKSPGADEIIETTTVSGREPQEKYSDTEELKTDIKDSKPVLKAIQNDTDTTEISKIREDDVKMMSESVDDLPKKIEDIVKDSPSLKETHVSDIPEKKISKVVESSEISTCEVEKLSALSRTADDISDKSDHEIITTEKPSRDEKRHAKQTEEIGSSSEKKGPSTGATPEIDGTEKPDADNIPDDTDYEFKDSSTTVSKQLDDAESEISKYISTEKPTEDEKQTAEQITEMDSFTEKQGHVTDGTSETHEPKKLDVSADKSERDEKHPPEQSEEIGRYPEEQRPVTDISPDFLETKKPGAGDNTDKLDHKIKTTSTILSERLDEAESEIPKYVSADKLPREEKQPAEQIETFTEKKDIVTVGSPDHDITTETGLEKLDEAESEISKHVSIEKPTTDEKEPAVDKEETPDIVPVVIDSVPEKYILEKSDKKEESITVKGSEDEKKGITVDGEQSQVTPKDTTEALEDKLATTGVKDVLEIVKHDLQDVSDKVSGVITTEVESTDDEINTFKEDVETSASSLYEEVKDISKGMIDAAKKLFDETTYSIAILSKDTEDSVEKLQHESGDTETAEDFGKTSKEIIGSKDVEKSVMIETKQAADKPVEEGRTVTAEVIKKLDDSRSPVKEFISEMKSSLEPQKETSSEISSLSLSVPTESKESVSSNEMESLEYSRRDEKFPDDDLKKMSSAIDQHKDTVRDISDPQFMMSKDEKIVHDDSSVGGDLKSRADDKFTKDTKTADDVSKSHTPGIKTSEPEGAFEEQAGKIRIDTIQDVEGILEEKRVAAVQFVESSVPTGIHEESKGRTSDLGSTVENVITDVTDISEIITPSVKEIIEPITKYEQPELKDKLESQLENIEEKIPGKVEILKEASNKLKDTREEVEDMSKSIILETSQKPVNEVVTTAEESSKEGGLPRVHHEMKKSTEDDSATMHDEVVDSQKVQELDDSTKVLKDSQKENISGTVDSRETESPTGSVYVEDLKAPVMTSESISETGVPETSGFTKTEKSVVESSEIIERTHLEQSDIEVDKTHEEKKILTQAKTVETTENGKKSPEVHEEIETSTNIFENSGKSIEEALKQEEAVIEKSVEDSETSFERVDGMTMSAVSETCDLGKKIETAVDLDLKVKDQSQDYEGGKRIIEDEKLNDVTETQVPIEQSEDLPRSAISGTYITEKQLISDNSMKTTKEEQHGKSDAEKDVDEIEKCKDVTESSAVKLEQSATDIEKIFETVQDLSKSVIFETCDSRDKKYDDQKLQEVPKEQDKMSKESSEESIKLSERGKSVVEPEKKQEEYHEKSDAEKHVDEDKKSDQATEDAEAKKFDSVDTAIETTVDEDKKDDTPKEVHLEKSRTGEIHESESTGDMSKSTFLETDGGKTILDSKHPIIDEVRTHTSETVQDMPQFKEISEDSKEILTNIHHELSDTKIEVDVGKESKHEKSLLEKSVVPKPSVEICEQAEKLSTDIHPEKSDVEIKVAVGPISDKVTEQEKLTSEVSDKILKDTTEAVQSTVTVLHEKTCEETEKTSTVLHHGKSDAEGQPNVGKESSQEESSLEKPDKLMKGTPGPCEKVFEKTEAITMETHHEEFDDEKKVSEAVTKREEAIIKKSEELLEDPSSKAQIMSQSVVTETSEGTCGEFEKISKNLQHEKYDTEKTVDIGEEPEQKESGLEKPEKILKDSSDAIQGMLQTAVPETFEKTCEKIEITLVDVKPDSETKIIVDSRSDKSTEQENKTLEKPDKTLKDTSDAVLGISETTVSNGICGESEETLMTVHYEKSDTEKLVDDGIESKQRKSVSKEHGKSLKDTFEELQDISQSVATETTEEACQKTEITSSDVHDEKSEAAKKVEVDSRLEEKGKLIPSKSDTILEDTSHAEKVKPLSLVPEESVGICKGSCETADDVHHEKSDAEKKVDAGEELKLEKSILEKPEKLPKDSFEEVQILSQAAVSESCKKTLKPDITDEEKSDPEKDFETASESGEHREHVEVLPKKTSEGSGGISETMADMSTTVIFTKCEYAENNKSITDETKLEKQQDATTKKVSETLGHVGDSSKFLESERSISVADIATRKDENREESYDNECTEKCTEPCQKYSDIKKQDAESNVFSSTIDDTGGFKSVELEKGEEETMEKCDKPDSSTTQQSIIPAIVDQKSRVEDLEPTPITLAGPSIAEKSKTEVQKQIEIQETLIHEKHIPGAVTPPTVPVSPNILDETIKSTAGAQALMKEVDLRSITPVSDDSEIIGSTHTDISEQVSKVHLDKESDDDDQLSIMSQIAHSRDSSHCEFEDELRKVDPMSMSLYGSLPGETSSEQGSDVSILAETEKTKYLAPSVDKTDVKLAESIDHTKYGSSHIDETSSSSTSQGKKDPLESWGKPLPLPAPTHLYELTQAKYSRGVHSICLEDKGSASDQQSESEEEETHHFRHEQLDVMSASFYGDLPSGEKDPLSSWGKPLGLPSPAPPNDNKGTPKKERKLPPNVSAKNKLNDDRKRAESPSKYNNRNKKITPVYVDLTYVPHHGNTNYSYVDFFKRVRARYYVFSGIEPSRDVYNALLEAKQTWEDKDLEVTIIPTYDTDILGFWVAENEEMLSKYKIDLSPSASRCTINLQDHETSCSAYRLEF